MNLPTIQTDKNLTMVCMDNVTLWYSYTTLVAFQVGWVKVVSKNIWTATTGKHLNQIDQGVKEQRVDRATFQAKWKELTASVQLPFNLGN